MNLLIASLGLTTFPRLFDIFTLSTSQCPCTKTLSGSGRSAAMRNAGQKNKWNLVKIGLEV